jgi:hypothetical protein
MRTRWIASVMAALMAFLPGCGDGSGDDAGGTSTQTASGSPSGNGTKTQQTGPEVGSVVKVVLSDAFIDGETTSDGVRIRAGQALSTDDSGTVDFSLDRKIKQCRLLTQSRMVAAPTKAVLIRWELGSVWCYTTAGGSPIVLGGPSDVTLAMSDPVFGVVVNGETITLRVVQGVVDVDSPGSEPLLVGSGQQVTIVDGEVPTQAEDFDIESLPQDERAIVSEYENAAPQPDFGPPEAGDSAGLGRILVTNGAINVGIDSTFAGNPAAETNTSEWRFIDDYFTDLAAHWGIGSSSIALTSDEARPQLDAGAVDVFVTPEPLSGFDSFPLLQDPQGRTWSVSLVGGDDGLRRALVSYVVATLQQKDYAITYQTAFDIENPPYEPLRPLLGL